MSVSKFKFRQKCPVFGVYPYDLAESQLPSYQDVLLCYQFERFRIGRLRGDNYEPRSKEVSEIVAKKVENIFKKASIPIVSHTRVLQMLTSYHNKFLTFKRMFLKNQIGLRSKRDEFVSSSAKLFDIAACKCPSFASCNCPKEKKVPFIEQPFLLDQRTRRIGRIGSVDLTETKKITKRNEHKEKLLKRHSTSTLTENGSATSFDHSDQPDIATDANDVGASNIASSKNDDDAEFCLQSPEIKRNTLVLEHTALAAQRFGLSDTAAALIVSSAFLDAKKAGLITENQARFVTDRCKISRAEKSVGMKLQNTESISSLYGLYFDGRKDNIQTRVREGEKYYRRTVKEEHISLVAEPGSHYIGHVTSTSGSAEDEMQAIWQHLQDNSIDMQHLQVVGADGTNTNTGWKGGVIRKLEEKLGRPLQWVVCLLHFNELPFRALFEHIDGVSKSPNTFAGDIGKLLPDCEKLPVVKFENFASCQLPSGVINPTQLSTDQSYLYKISEAVISGQCSSDLALMHPGNMCKSRWVTCANRILRLYISTNNPTKEMKILVKYILTVYSPLWFLIRFHNSIKDGSRHLFAAIQRSRYLPAKLRKIVDASIQQNAFFALPENILLSMMTDEREEVRKVALDRLLAAREEQTDTVNGWVRYNKVPKLNFKAKNYYDMIDWNTITLTVPPVLRSASNSELITWLSRDTAEVWQFCEFPSHTVAVERTVKLVTEASSKIIGPQSRDRFIRSTLKSRQELPNFGSKSDFVNKYDTNSD
ncbi:MAU2 chromatid cohesion factor-like protein [Frankliniella fusca]|uniref:MAU2 chromatid cohesion factor-like protein n=1 Tax=Frankliniella fusca TaxID=407009 RepID=A0AAE1HQ24_9NEOP|nr:MAU2 chromatid cohesion factor-like protein [Frankliniella fusca]